MPDIIPFNAENNLTVDGTTATITIDSRIAAETWTSDYLGWVTPKAFRSLIRAAGDGITTWVISLMTPGGSTTAGAAIGNMVRDLGKSAKTIAQIDAAGSAGSVVALHCQTVRIAENGHFFIHQAIGAVEGREDYVRSFADRIGQLNSEMKDLYVSKSGQSEADVLAWMDKQTWFNGKKAVSLGFCDELTHAIEGLDAFQPDHELSGTPHDQPFSGFHQLCAEFRTRRHMPPTAEEPATDTEDDDMAAATLKELKAALPKADSDFLVAQLEAEADVPTATAAWADHLQAKLDAAEEAKASAEQAKTEAETKAAEAEAKATQQKPGSKGVTEAGGGGDPDADADDEEQKWDAPTAEWRKRLEKKLDRGTPRSEAVGQLREEEPELYAAYLGQHESRMNRNRSRGSTRRVAR